MNEIIDCTDRSISIVFVGTEVSTISIGKSFDGHRGVKIE